MAKPSSYGVAPQMGGKMAVKPKKPMPTAAKPKAAGGAAAPMPTAVKRYTGAFSGPLNNLSDQEQRAMDVGARRQADAKAYASYVMGQQGKFAAAAQAQDQKAVGQLQGIQAQSLRGIGAIQSGLQSQRAAQGGQGPVPTQQLSGVVDDAQANHGILGAISQNASDRANTNQGKAGFLAAAAQSSLLANQRGIAGQTQADISAIQRDKTGILTERTRSSIDNRRAREANAAAVQAAEISAANDAADRSSREGIAYAELSAADQRASADRQEGRYQKSRDRQVSLQKSRNYAGKDGGFVTPVQAAKRTTSVRKLESDRNAVIADLSGLRDYAKKNGLPFTVAEAKTLLAEDHGKLPKEVQDYALAKLFGRKAKVTRGRGPSAAARYTALLNQIKSGKINY